MPDVFDNPMGLDGFEFVEFASPEPGAARARISCCSDSKPLPGIVRREVTLYPPGRYQFYSQRMNPTAALPTFAQEHGALPLAAWHFGSRDAHRGLQHAHSRLGAQPIDIPTGPMELRLPAIKGIGGFTPVPDRSLHRKAAQFTISTSNFSTASIVTRTAAAFQEIDHLTHNVYRGRMELLGEHYYEKPFQLPRNSLFRYQRRVHRTLVQGNDGARWSYSRIPLNEEVIARHRARSRNS